MILTIDWIPKLADVSIVLQKSSAHTLRGKRATALPPKSSGPLFSAHFCSFFFKLSAFFVNFWNDVLVFLQNIRIFCPKLGFAPLNLKNSSPVKIQLLGDPYSLLCSRMSVHCLWFHVFEIRKFCHMFNQERDPNPIGTPNYHWNFHTLQGTPWNSDSTVPWLMN